MTPIIGTPVSVPAASAALPLLTATELTAMRAQAAVSMVEVVVIWTATNATDGQGGSTPTWATATTMGRLAAGGGVSEQALAEALGSRTAWTVWLPYGTAVTAQNRIVIAGRTFEVLGIVAPHTYETARGAVCVELL